MQTQLEVMPRHGNAAEAVVRPARNDAQIADEPLRAGSPDAPAPPPSTTAVASPLSLPSPSLTSATSKALREEIGKAMLLLHYAAEEGVKVDAELRTRILVAEAESQGCHAMPAPLAARLLDDITTLAAALKPVSPDAVEACRNGRASRRNVRILEWTACILALLIIPMSVITFMITSLSDATSRDIEAANALVVRLSNELGAVAAPVSADDAAKGLSRVNQADVIQELQALAGTTRTIARRGRQMNLFVLKTVRDPFADFPHNEEGRRAAFELPATLANEGPIELFGVLSERIAVYQTARDFAQNTREWISTVYGAISVSLLPVAYALLGACASLLRQFQRQFRTRTFTGKDSHAVRFLIAAIGGGVVGLFHNFVVGDGASVSPLAVAFLVGYAAEVFFSFLDSTVRSVNREGGSEAVHATK